MVRPKLPDTYPELSQSIATVLCNDSPLHAYMAHPLLGGVDRKPSKQMEFGSVIHKLLLGKGDKFAAIEGGHADWRTKDAKAQAAELRKAGVIPMLKAEYSRAIAVADILRDKLAARGVVFDGIIEKRIRWTERAVSGVEVRCAGTPDHVTWDGSTLVIDDLKTAATANPRKVGRSWEQFCYDIQWAAYTSGGDKVYRANGRVRMRYVTVEVDAPYCVTIVEPDGSMRQLGSIRWQNAVNKWARCVAENHWPEYAEGVVQVSASPWALERAEEEMSYDENV